MRQLSIPAIRDRVVQGALKLVLEPIFEADFQAGSATGQTLGACGGPTRIGGSTGRQDLRNLSGFAIVLRYGATSHRIGEGRETGQR